jgi:predicted ATPase/DNA-binding winged helix-turn-helix (wHTH) protein
MSSWAFDAPSGRFELLQLQRRLLRDGVVVPLGARALDVLLALVAQNGEVVSRESLLDTVWPDLHVEENNLSVQVNALRKALGPDVVLTVPGRGYTLACRLERAGVRDAAGAAAVLPARPRTPTPALVGRERELQELVALLTHARLTTLVGTGGVGKTRLAQAALLELAPAQGSGFIDLTTLKTEAELPGAVASGLGLQLRGGDPLAALAAALAGLEMVVVLDNAEHLAADVAALVSALLAATAGLRCLVTSQVPLQLPQEQLVRLEGLALPDSGAQADAALALRSGAVALFAARAQALDRRFAVTAGNVGDVVEVVRRLEGLPLALELAAARLQTLGLSRLRASLEQRLALLTQGWRGAPPRQQSLRAALLWSHGLLGKAEQVVFRRMAVFVGSASLSLVQEVLPDAMATRGVNGGRVLEARDTLIQRSLVRVSPESPQAPDSEPRYRLLESPLALAREQLEASGEASWLAQRLAVALGAQFQRLDDQLWRGDGTQGWRPVDELMAADIGNAQTSLDWALAHDAVLALRLGTTLSRVLGANRYRERIAVCRKLEVLLDAPGSDALPAAVRGHAALQCAEASNMVAQACAARARQAAEWLKQAGEPKGVYVALCVQARAMARLGDLQSLGLVMAEIQTLEDPSWPAAPRVMGAMVRSSWCRLLRDPEGSRHWMHETAALLREAGRSDVAPMVNLIGIERRAGRHAQAIAIGEALVARLQGTRQLLELAHTWVNLCSVQIEHGDLAAARRLVRSAWPMVRQFDLHPNWADNAALLASAEGRSTDVLKLIGCADHAYARLGASRDEYEVGAVQAAEQRACAWLAGVDPLQPATELKLQGVALADDALLQLALGPEPAASPAAAAVSAGQLDAALRA